MLNQATDTLYSRARDQGRRGQVWSTLTGRSRRLLALDEIEAICTVHIYKKVRDDSARLQERFLLSLHNLLIAVGIKWGVQVVSK